MMATAVMHNGEEEKSLYEIADNDLLDVVCWDADFEAAHHQQQQQQQQQQSNLSSESVSERN